MRSNRKHTTADLIYYIHLYEDGYSYRELSEKIGLLLSDATFYSYYLKFMEHGMAGLESSRKNNSYSQAFKERIVQEYLQTNCSSWRKFFYMLEDDSVDLAAQFICVVS